MTEGLQYREEEFQALAVKWDGLSEEDQEHFRDKMTRPQWRRFERKLDAWREAKGRKHGAWVTHRDMATFHTLYVERVITPLEKRIIALEAWAQYQEKPWYRRLLLWCSFKLEQLLVWLEAHGIRLVSLEEDEDGTRDDQDHGDARGSERGQPEDGAGALHRLAAEDGLRPEPGADVGEPTVRGPGARRGDEAGDAGRVEPSDIEVVRR